MSIGLCGAGSRVSAAGALSGVRFDGLSMPPLPAYFAPSDRDVEDLNIGNRVMEKYFVTFDYRRTLITFAPAHRC